MINIFKFFFSFSFQECFQIIQFIGRFAYLPKQVSRRVSWETVRNGRVTLLLHDLGVSFRVVFLMLYVFNYQLKKVECLKPNLSSESEQLYYNCEKMKNVFYFLFSLDHFILYCVPYLRLSPLTPFPTSLDSQHITSKSYKNVKNGRFSRFSYLDIIATLSFVDFNYKKISPLDVLN
jgi:hypothetical protein